MKSSPAAVPIEEPSIEMELDLGIDDRFELSEDNVRERDGIWFSIETSSGEILRHVTLSDGPNHFWTTSMGPLPTDFEGDLASAAELALLRARSQPLPSSSSRGTLKVADLFSGCGAMSLGVAEACRGLGLQFESVAFDSSQTAMDAYRRNFPRSSSIVGDLRSLLETNVDTPLTSRERSLRRKIGRIDLLIAGPPCQGHSNLNNHTRRDDPKNELYLLVARFAKIFRPKFIIVENVTTVLNDRGRVVDRTKSALRALRYDVDDGVLDLAKLGLPQTRRRHALIAVARRTLRKKKMRLPSISDIAKRNRCRTRNVLWAIGDLADKVQESGYDAPAKPSRQTIERIRFLYESNAYDLPAHLRPNCHRTNPSQFKSYRAVYGRMFADEPAPTITGGFDTMGRGRFVHPTRPRTLTPHEAARIQLIPDFFDLTSVEKRTELCDIIGNAVPPKMSYVLALELLR